MTDHPNGHLATLDGDLDDLTAEEARLVPACDATDCAVLWVMGERLTYDDRPLGTESIWKMRQNGKRIAILSPVHKSPTPRIHPSTDPRAAHEAREWLRGQGYVLRERDQLTDEAGMRIKPCWLAYKSHPTRHGLREVAFSLAPTEHLATARLILVLYAKDLL